MKKYFLSLVAMAAMLFATSCQESLVEPQVGGPTTFTVQVPDAMGTKAIGDKENVNQLLVAVYSDANVDPVALTRATATSTSGEFKVQFNLLQDQSYDIVFWAQVEDEYVDATNNNFELKSIPMKYDNHNNEDGAAFFAYVADFVPTGSAQSVTLKRPFAQLNLGTTEQSLKPATGDVSLVSSEIKITGLAQIFNTISGMGENPKTEVVTFSADIPEDWQPLSAANHEYVYVSMDYLPIVGDAKAVFDIEANIVVKDAAGDEKPIKHKFTSVPVQENYRTNIVGNLISSTSDFIVSIDDRFVDENGSLNPDNDYLVVDNVYAAEVAFNNGETHVAINNIGNTQTLQLPDNGKELYLQLPDSDGKITIKRDAGNFNISVPDTNPLNTGLTIIIEAPNSTVGFTGQALVINSTTASNTLNLNEAKVGTIVVIKGNVVAQNYTTVSNLSVDDNLTVKVELKVDDSSSIKVADADKDQVTYIIEISSAEELIALSASVDDGNTYDGTTIKLTNDIDLSSDNWNPIGDNRTDRAFSGIFDGQNHTITGAHITGDHCFNGAVYGSKEGWGLFSVVDGATIQNLNIDGATFGSYTVITGTIAGYANNTTFQNIKITNTKIAGYNWYTGGVVGWAQGKCNFINVDLDNTVSVGTLWDSHGQNAGGIAGGVSADATITIEDCDIACVLDVINDVTSNYKWCVYRVSGMIIGNTNTTEIKYNEVVTATATNVTCKNVTVTYGKWMNYHYCEGYWNRGWGRYESSEYVGGVNQNEPHNHADGEEHLVTFTFDQLFGGSSNGSGHYPVKGLAEFPGVTVIYPAEYTCTVCGEQHNVVSEEIN